MDTYTKKKLVEWAINATELNPDKGIIRAAKDFCEMNNIEYNGKIVEPLLFNNLIN